MGVTQNGLQSLLSLHSSQKLVINYITKLLTYCHPTEVQTRSDNFIFPLKIQFLWHSNFYILEDLPHLLA